MSSFSSGKYADLALCSLVERFWSLLQQWHGLVAFAVDVVCKVAHSSCRAFLAFNGMQSELALLMLKPLFSLGGNHTG